MTNFYENWVVEVLFALKFNLIIILFYVLSLVVSLNLGQRLHCVKLLYPYQLLFAILWLFL